jgi:hypothetical protein
MHGGIYYAVRTKFVTDVTDAASLGVVRPRRDGVQWEVMSQLGSQRGLSDTLQNALMSWEDSNVASRVISDGSGGEC